MNEFSLWLPAAFFLIALLYSTAGLAGGSSYLALLILSGLSYREVPPLALLCNIIVSLSGFLNFWRAGHLVWRKVLPFAVLSVPMAYVGGLIPVDKQVFCFLLGLSLLIAAVRMLLPDGAAGELREIGWMEGCAWGIPVGGFFGFLSGLVGIGGGIFLSPFLILMRWADAKQAAACASFFILINSLSGLAGHLQKGALNLQLALPLGLAVFIGGQAGSRLGSGCLSKTAVARLAGALVLYVSIKLFMRGLG